MIESRILTYFSVETIVSACYTMNRVLLRPLPEKAPYEIFKGIKTIISYFHVFGCKYYILKNVNDNIGKFDTRANEGTFLVYLTSNKIYCVQYNIKGIGGINKCQECISKWLYQGSSVYRITPRIWRLEQDQWCLLTKKGILWTQTSTKSMKWKTDHISYQTWFWER